MILYIFYVFIFFLYTVPTEYRMYKIIYVKPTLTCLVAPIKLCKCTRNFTHQQQYTITKLLFIQILIRVNKI